MDGNIDFMWLCLFVCQMKCIGRHLWIIMNELISITFGSWEKAWLQGLLSATIHAWNHLNFLVFVVPGTFGIYRFSVQSISLNHRCDTAFSSINTSSQRAVLLKDNSDILNIEPPFWFVYEIEDEIEWLTPKFWLLVLSRVFGSFQIIPACFRIAGYGHKSTSP